MKPRIVAMMRIKNEEEWIGQSLEAASKLAEAIVILDDGSTDRTPEICRSFPKVVRYSRQEEPEINEARDKNKLLAMALELEPDWVLALDGDEVLEAKAASVIRKEISYVDPANPQFSSFAIHILYFWGHPERYRVDPGIYGDFWQVRLFTTWGQDVHRLAFSSTAHGGNFHCGSVPGNLQGPFKLIDVKVKHYGYFHPEQRLRKQQQYFLRDPAEAAKGYYDHLTSEEGMELAAWRERKGRIKGQHFIKSCKYYQNQRLPLIEMVPPEARKILDLGCGFGKLGRLLKDLRPDCRVVGVEEDHWAAQAASLRLDKVLVGNVEQMRLPFPLEYFDCIILADLLEYTVDPWTLLVRLGKYLQPRGLIIATLANPRNLFYLMELIKGKRNPGETGINDPARLRSFTLDEGKELFAFAALEIREVKSIADTRFKLTGERHQQTMTIETPDIALKNIKTQELEQFEAAEFIIAAGKKKRSGPTGKPMVSIVVVTCNQLAYTQKCLDSLLQYTRSPYELIVVDNGSTDGTKEYLLSQSGVKSLFNARNQGFALASNQGLAAAAGEHVVFLNNDVIVTEGWLENLVKWAEQYPQVGLVGPHTNYVVGVQRLETIDYSDESGIQDFARRCQRDNLNRGVEVERLVGFCLLVKRSLIQKIGGFDPRFGQGNFEDDDYCLRARIAGYKLIMAEDVFVHHYGSVTFLGEGIDYQGTLAEGWRKFKNKWSIDPQRSMAEGYHAGSLVVPFNQVNHYLQYQEQPQGETIYSIIMVTYNSALTIRDCVESILNNSTDYELIVVDNNSRDETVRQLEIMANLYPQLKLIINQENRGFAKAVNQGFQIAAGSYVVLLNPDVQVTPGWLSKLREKLNPGVGAVGPVSNYVGGQQRIDFYTPSGIDPNQASNLFLAQILQAKGLGPVETKLLIGFCLMMTADLFQEIGLDEEFILGSEDLDLSWRLRLQGYQLIIATDVFIRHHGQVSFKSEPEEEVRKLVALSTERLVQKLRAHYGPEQVPSCLELWGVDWFETRGGSG